ncbi:MAG: hypothetical protein ACTSXX_03625 [Candidatus Baldrarchaeia archaeon]
MGRRLLLAAWLALFVFAFFSHYVLPFRSLIIPIISNTGEKILWIVTLLSLPAVIAITGHGTEESAPLTVERRLPSEYARQIDEYEQTISRLQKRIRELERELQRLREGHRAPKLRKGEVIISEIPEEEEKEEIKETSEEGTPARQPIGLIDKVSEIEQKIIAAEELLRRAQEQYGKGAIPKEVYMRIKEQCEEKIRRYKEELANIARGR